MERLAHKLLPLLLALVAALVLVTGIHGFRAEHPSLPAAFNRLTTPFVTEAPAPPTGISLADGRQVQLEPGTPEQSLWDYLAAGSPAPRSFTFADAAVADAGADAGAGVGSGASAAPQAGANATATANAPELWLRLAAILTHHPAARVALAGAPAPGLRHFLLAHGVAESRLSESGAVDPDAGAAPATDSPDAPAADAGVLRLTVNPPDQSLMRDRGFPPNPLPQ